MIAAEGTQTKQIALSGNATGTSKVTDTFFEQISNVQGVTLTTPTLINSFNVSEPVTLRPIGASLGLLRRRLQKI